MGEVIGTIGWIVLVVSLLGACYSLGAGAAVGWFFSRASPAASEFPAVSILKPLHGDEPGLRACLDGFCIQDYPAPVQIIFGVRDASDAAIPIVRALALDNPGLHVDLVVNGGLYGSNLKISNLINMERLIRHPVVVLADSDVTVRRDYLRRLVAALSAPGVGFATCAYVGRSTGNLWSRLSAMAIDLHFLPSVAFGLRLKLARPCFGPTIAFRKDVLDQIGGFRPFADHLADDYEIGRAIRGLGYGFAIPPLVIGHGCPERDARSLVSHELRWARTIRMIDPLSYAGSAVCHPLPWALLAVVLLQGAVASVAALTAVLLSRLFVLGQVNRAAGVRDAAWWLLPARDLLSFAIYLSAYLVKTVSWRGHRFRLGPKGVLVPHVSRAQHGSDRRPRRGTIAPAAIPMDGRERRERFS